MTTARWHLLSVLFFGTPIGALVAMLHAAITQNWLAFASALLFGLTGSWLFEYCHQKATR